MKLVRAVFKVFLFILLVILITLISALFYYFSVNSSVHLDKNKLINNQLTYEYYDRNGELFFSQNAKQNVEYIKLNDLNDYTINAFISIEDKRFYSHNGIDYKRIVGAILNNAKALKLKEGASTISQQLIKNTHLTSEKTLKRKLNEIYLTKQLEKEYSKDEILEIYLNTIYFGGGAYGINNASKYYFNKSASELTLNESVTLAAIIKAPATYSPIINYSNAFNRKNLVLKSMYENNFISKSEYLSSVNKNINLIKNNNNYLSSYVKAVNNELNDKLNVNPYITGTIKIYTYLDKSIQKNISEINYNSTLKYNREQIVKSNKNNEIIAYFGEYSTLKRSPASCIKPWYVYAPLINENLITESTVLVDEETDFNGYKPKNFSNKYYGNITAKTALSKSSNVCAVKLLSMFGFDVANKYANKLNVNINSNNLSSALGAIDNGLTLLELTDCYTTFANSGNFCEGNFIDEVKINNTTAYKRKVNFKKVFSSETAYIISDMLNDSTLNGTSKKLKNSNYKVYAKTGTNGNENGNLDAYSICYTSEHTIGVWLGNYDNTLLDNSILGGTYPAIYTKNALDYLYANHYPNDVEIPKQIIAKEIDEEYLLKNQKTYLSNGNGKTYYYIKGTEPTEYLLKSTNPSIKNVNLETKNSSINIKIDGINANKYIIVKFYNNSTCAKKVISTNYYLDENLYDGIYYYEITPILQKDNQEVVGETYKTPSIKISKNKKILSKKWWE